MVKIKNSKINVSQLIRKGMDEECGAILCFIGTVRKHNKGKEVKKLFYDTYDKMCLKVMGEIEKEAIERFNVRKVNIVHRKGTLKPGEVILFISVSSVHRKEGFDALRFIIEEIKKRLPVWKKEFFKDKEEWVEGIPLHP